MFTNEKYSTNKKDGYSVVIKQLKALSEDVNNNITILSNASALLNGFLENINWVGFYLLENDCLYLGPFQGKVACTKIKVGQGICGMAIAENTIMRIDDVTTHPNHIACDSASKSEIVLPITINHQLYGVLDIDAPVFSRFDFEDEQYLKTFVEVLATYLK